MSSGTPSELTSETAHRLNLTHKPDTLRARTQEYHPPFATLFPPWFVPFPSSSFRFFFAN